VTQRIEFGTHDVMQVCEAVELSCAELYQYFACLFKDDREKFLLWTKSAMEEENHARLFALVGKLRRSNIEFIQYELVEADVALFYVQALIKKVKKTPPPIDDALRISIDLKNKMNGFMQENIIKFAHDSCEQSLLAMTNPGSRGLKSFQESYSRVMAA